MIIKLPVRMMIKLLWPDFDKEVCIKEEPLLFVLGNITIDLTTVSDGIPLMGETVNSDFLLRKMSEYGVDVSHIERSEESTGIAAISVGPNGRNSIIVVPRANFDKAIVYGQLTASYSGYKGAQSSMPNFGQFEAYQKTIKS
jgi:hypothetical protein